MSFIQRFQYIRLCASRIILDSICQGQRPVSHTFCRHNSQRTVEIESPRAKSILYCCIKLKEACLSCKRIPVNTAWRVLWLRIDERPLDREGSCEYVELAIADSRQGWSSGLGLGEVLTNPHCTKLACYEKFHTVPDLNWRILVGGSESRRDHLEDTVVDGMIILKWIFKKWKGAWTGLIWLRIGTGGGLFRMR